MDSMHWLVLVVHIAHCCRYLYYLRAIPTMSSGMDTLYTYVVCDFIYICNVHPRAVCVVCPVIAHRFLA